MLTKAKAVAPVSVGGIPWVVILGIIEHLVKVLGPLALPIIEGWIAKLPLTPAQIAALDAFIENLLSKVP